jgi:hypothetical protein
VPTKAKKSDTNMTSNNVPRLEFEAEHVLNTTPVARPVQSELPAEFADYDPLVVAAVQSDLEIQETGRRSYGADIAWAENVYIMHEDILRAVPNWKECCGAGGKADKAFAKLSSNERAMLFPVKKQRLDYYALAAIMNVENPYIRWSRLCDNVAKLLDGSRKMTDPRGGDASEGEGEGEGKGAGAAKRSADEMAEDKLMEAYQRFQRLSQDDKYDGDIDCGEVARRIASILWDQFAIDASTLIKVKA